MVSTHYCNNFFRWDDEHMHRKLQEPVWSITCWHVWWYPWRHRWTSRCLHSFPNPPARQICKAEQFQEWGTVEVNEAESHNLVLRYLCLSPTQPSLLAGPSIGFWGNFGPTAGTADGCCCHPPIATGPCCCHPELCCCCQPPVDTLAVWLLGCCCCQLPTVSPGYDLLLLAP